MFNDLIGKSRHGGRDCMPKFNHKLFLSIGKPCLCPRLRKFIPRLEKSDFSTTCVKTHKWI